MADNSDTENPLGNWVDDELGGTVGPIVGEGPAAGTPGEFDHLDLDALGLGLSFGQTHPSHFGIGEDHRRNEVVAIHRVAVAGEVFNSDAGLLAGLVRQHDAASDVADGINVRVVGDHALIHLDEPLVIPLDARVLKSEVLPVGHSADGHQHSVILFVHLLAVELGSDLDLLSGGLNLQNLRLEAYFLEGLLGVGRHGSDEVGVGSGQHRFHGLDDRDLGTHRRVHRAEFHADVAAADDEQLFRDVGDF